MCLSRKEGETQGTQCIRGLTVLLRTVAPQGCVVKDFLSRQNLNIHIAHPSFTKAPIPLPNLTLHERRAKMAPSEVHSIDRTPEYYDFMEKLKKYHEERGTTLEPEPKVGSVHLDLYKVFKHVVENGGYDEVSREKLAWRRMASDLNIYGSNEASAAFSLKEKFYKNLAAYEIKTVHGEEPPPKDILEDTTAKGGELRTRTRENFPRKRESNIGPESAASGDDATPARERSMADGPTSTSNSRASRGLREAPAQRVIFQPETGPSRPTRHSSGQQASHANSPATNSQLSAPPSNQYHSAPTPTVRSGGQPSMQPQLDPPKNWPAAAVAYEPRNPLPTIPMRPVHTPGNNPGEFARRRQLALAQTPAKAPLQPGSKSQIV
jgi:chromatin structure-remodeling complex subunit RSC9